MVLADEIERLEELLEQDIVIQNSLFEFTLEDFIDQFCLAELH